MEGFMVGIAAWTLIGLAGCVAQDGTTKEQAATTPAVQPTAKADEPAKVTPVGEFASADALLVALESADKDMKSLSCDLLWSKEFYLGGDTHTRTGKLFFVDERVGAAPAKEGAPAVERRRKFAVQIEAMKMQGGKDAKDARLDQARVDYVFDGKLLVERKPNEKRILRHQLGNKVGADPLKIGEGPIPLPIGQKREDILSRFNVELLPPETDLVSKDADPEDDVVKLVQAKATGCVQLKLVPKPEHERECTFKEARLWFKRMPGVDGAPGRLLPQMARAKDKQDNTDTVLLIGVKVNVEVTSAFDTSVPKGWEEQVLGGGAN